MKGPKSQTQVQAQAKAQEKETSKETSVKETRIPPAAESEAGETIAEVQRKIHIAKADVWGGLRVFIGKENANRYFYYQIEKQGDRYIARIKPVPETEQI